MKVVSKDSRRGALGGLVAVLALLASVLAGVPTANAQDPDWLQRGATIEGQLLSDYMGWSVAISADGTRVAIGAPGPVVPVLGAPPVPGIVRVFDWTGASWDQAGDDIWGQVGNDQFGTSVAMSADGSRLAVGAPGNDGNGNNAGRVRIIDWSGSAWETDRNLDGTVPEGGFGSSVSLNSSGTRLAVGAPGSDQVLLFRRTLAVINTWPNTDELNGEAAGDRFGSAVAMSGDGNTLAVGAGSNDGAGVNAGHVRMFERSGSDWAQVGADIDGTAPSDLLGFSVALSSDGTRLAAGAPGAGQVRILGRFGDAWVQADELNGEASGDRFGWSVAMGADGKHLIVGAPRSGDAGPDAGQARMFENAGAGSTWSQVGSDLDGEAASDASGSAVAMSADGSSVAIGAHQNLFAPGQVQVLDFVGPELEPKICAGLEVTIDMNVPGTSGVGTAGPDVILGTPGPDVIDSGAGQDRVCGGDGDDVINTGDDYDWAIGGNGDDTISAGFGIDIVFGQAGNDTINGEGGSDWIWAGEGDDIVFAGSGADRVFGGDGADTLNGMGGQDFMWGDAGNDIMQGNWQSDELHGGDGNDTIRGAAGKDRLYGDTGDDELFGGVNTDWLDGGDGIDIADGQAGKDNPLIADVSGCQAETVISC